MFPNNSASTRNSSTNLINTNANQSLNDNPKMDPNNIVPVKATHRAGALGPHGSFTGNNTDGGDEEEDAPVSLFALVAAAIANVDNHHKDSIIPEDESVLALARLGGLSGQMWAYKEPVESSADILGRSSTWVTNASAQYYPSRQDMNQQEPTLHGLQQGNSEHRPSPLYLRGVHSPLSDYNTPPLSHSAFSTWSASTGHSSSVGSVAGTDANSGTPPDTPSSIGHAGFDSHMHRLSLHHGNLDKPHSAISSSDIPSTVPSLSLQSLYNNLPSPFPHHPVSQAQLVGFLSPLFPQHATIAIACARLLEIVLPHTAPVLIGAVIDLPASPAAPSPAPDDVRRSRPGRRSIDTGGRTVFLSLPPFNPTVASGARDSASRASSDAVGAGGKHEVNVNIDIRDHLTSLLDLVSDAVEAMELVLVLDRRNREDEELREFLHALAYVGGVVLRSGKVRGGLEWDEKRWVLVGIEL
ncbi:hypothetical protein QFC21_005478 [Naganishia friedmannii]|uniref:Uncharacterized protein n=1 Tax=Naganishia friedmannii TaxID=89922 RepID=A0ACC2V9F8_9TREE|nr:hypothetical protein QFC21_005478 [Naganishia friedmannii]